MRGEKTKSPGKEFAAQVSDYIPSPRRKTKSDEVEPPSRSNPDLSELSPRSTRKPDRPWSLLSTPDSADSATAEETGHKPSTNWIQTEYKSVTKPDTNRLQTGHDNSGEIKQRLETGHKLDTQPDTQRDTNRTQTSNKPDTHLAFTRLVGLQRKVLIFIYRACQIARGRLTDPLALEHIARSLNIRTGSVKTTLRRLEEKGYIHRIEFKNGRGGWSKYELPNPIFTAMFQLETEHKLDTNRLQTEHKLDTQPDTEPDTTPSSSSSKDLDLNKLTNTGNIGSSTDLPSEWDQVDTGPLSAIHFGRQQLVQLVRLGALTADQAQESINAFAFDLEVNGKGRDINGHALNYFMGILRKGPYAPSANYEPPGIRQMRLYLETKEREQKARKELELKFEAVEFEEWMAKVSPEEKMKVVPPTEFMKPGGAGYTSQLREYFRENIWPQSRENFLREVNSPK